MNDTINEALDNMVEALEFANAHPDVVAAYREMQRALFQAEKAAGEADDVSTDFARAVIDQRAMNDRGRKKYYANRRTKKRGVMVHHSAVEGGAGAWSSDVRAMEKLEPSKSVGNVLLLEDHDDLIKASRSWARAFALGKRYRGRENTPSKNDDGWAYHAITGGNSVLYLNLDFDLVSWHGDEANFRFLGYCWDGNSRKQEPDDDDLCWDLERLIAYAWDDQHQIEELTVHSAWSNKPHDPGARYIQQVLLPVAKETKCKVDMDFKTNGGRSIRQTLEGK